eukprot:scaffold455_cov155-Ochromonas_danica.AAC.11
MQRGKRSGDGRRGHDLQEILRPLQEIPFFIHSSHHLCSNSEFVLFAHLPLLASHLAERREGVAQQAEPDQT